MKNTRLLNAFLVIASVLGTVYALYLQYALHLDPCPLCIFQRIGLWAMGIFAILSVIFNPKNLSKWLLWLGSFVGAIWSFGVASRHTWLQHLPADKVPACGPGLNYWVETLPILQVFEQVLKGSGECAVIDWTLFGVSIPEQSMVFFGVLILVHIIIAWQFLKTK